MIFSFTNDRESESRPKSGLTGQRRARWEEFLFCQIDDPLGFTRKSERGPASQRPESERPAIADLAESRKPACLLQLPNPAENGSSGEPLALR